MLLRAPFSDPPQSLGRGATLGEFSADGQWIAWLASKERGDRTGPAKVRAIGGSTPFDLGPSMPPFVIGRDAMLSLTSYRGDSGRGMLQTTRLANGAHAPVLNDVAPNEFASVGGEFIAVQRPSNGGPCRAMRLDALASHPVPISADLDCALAPAFVVAPDGSAALFRHASGALTRWSPGSAAETPVASQVEAAAFDRRGGVWWAERRGADLVVWRDGILIGVIDGRFARAIYPAGDAGAWLLLADRLCLAAAPSPAPACQRFVAVGDAALPPDSGVIRKVVASPGGFPLAFFAGDQTPPALLAVPAPGRIVPITALGIAAEISPDGTHVAAVAWLDDGQRALLADLATGEVRELSRGVPSARVLWAGKILLHTFETRKSWELFDDRNGVYAVDP